MIAGERESQADGTSLDWTALSGLEQEILMDLREKGPDCAKFLSRRFSVHPSEMMNLLNNLKERAWIERVKGTFLHKKGLKRPKHMNHTYFQLSRPGELEIRRCLRSGREA